MIDLELRGEIWAGQLVRALTTQQKTHNLISNHYYWDSSLPLENKRSPHPENYSKMTRACPENYGKILQNYTFSHKITKSVLF